MHSTAKGNSLEDALVEYFTEQQERGDLVNGAHPPNLCKIRKKAKYPCRDRAKPVEFDVVIEVYRESREKPYLYVVFECKNYKSGVPEDRARVFSDQITSVFGHSVKGILVVSSRLQSGAEMIARSRSMGVLKFSENGADIVLDRRGGTEVESAFLRSQIFADQHHIRSLKFSACFGGIFFSSIGQMLEHFDRRSVAGAEHTRSGSSPPHMPLDDIRAFATEIVEGIDYKDGPVDLEKICSVMELKLKFSEKIAFGDDGKIILGSANFERNEIEVNLHQNKFRERFTIAHEIGHFCLGHGLYLRSETVAEQDLLMDTEKPDSFNLTRLELQANLFASELIFPNKIFQLAVSVACDRHDMIDIGFGRIYVDDNDWNYKRYNLMISELSDYFLASKKATEFRLKRLGLVNDQRRFGNASAAMSLGDIFARIDLNAH